MSATDAGSGSGAISRYDITNVADHLHSANPNTIDTVTFDIGVASANTVKIQLVGGGTWYDCTTTPCERLRRWRSGAVVRRSSLDLGLPPEGTKPGMAKARSRNRGHWASFKALVDLWVDLFNRHNLLTYASAIAFQTFVAVVALLLLVLGVLSEIGRQDVWTKQIAPEIEPRVLQQVFDGINATVDKIFGSSSIGLIVFAAVLTIWETSGVVRACMGAFAQIYEDEETRPWWIRFPISFGISIVLTAGVLGALLLTTAARTAVHGAWGIPFAIARWLFALALLTLAFGILVRYAPVKPRTSRWASGGAVLCVVAWTVQSLIFTEYLRTFANYKSAAGSLLGIYFVTTFLYVAAIILMVGVELDEQLREDVSEGEERGILELVRDVL